MRRIARIDANQPALVSELRAAGFRVSVVSMLGGGHADLIVARNGVMRWVEVKNPDMPPSARALTEAEAKWQAEWSGYVITVERAEQVFDYWSRLRA